MITKDELGKKIRELRQKTGKSQQELGRALSRSHAAVSDIERGKTNLSVSDLYTIAKFFGVSITEFLGDEIYNPIPAFIHSRDARDISPTETALADKYAKEFMILARKMAEEQKET